MSDRQKVIVSLHLLSSTTGTFISQLASNNAPSSRQTHPPMSLESLHGDLISLLSFVYADTTKVTLTLNPPNMQPSYRGALDSLRDFIAHVSSLAANASSFDHNTHGRTLSAEVISTVSNILNAVRDFASIFAAHVSSGKQADKNSEAHLVIKAATIHELIDAARGSDDSGVSSCNAVAVRKKWGEYGEILQDAVLELENDDLDETPGLGASRDTDEIETGEHDWEDEQDTKGKAERTQGETQFQRDLCVLFKRVLDVSNEVHMTLESSNSTSVTTLDHLLDSAPALTSAVDDLASCVYEGTTQLLAYKVALAKALRAVGRATDNLLEVLDGSSDDKKGSRAWFQQEFQALFEEIKKIECPKDSD